MAAAQLDRCRAETVLREDAGDCASFVERQQREVAPVQLADARFGEAQADAGHGEQGLGSGGREIDGHLQPLSGQE